MYMVDIFLLKARLSYHSKGGLSTLIAMPATYPDRAGRLRDDFNDFLPLGQVFLLCSIHNSPNTRAFLSINGGFRRS